MDLGQYNYDNNRKNSIYAKWRKLVNMSVDELKAFLQTKEGKEAGLSKSEAREQGIKSGHESAEWILKMKKTSKIHWTDEMYEWAERQINFIQRMSGVDGPLYDKKGEKTRKHTSLLLWGHNPSKHGDGAEIKKETENNRKQLIEEFEAIFNISYDKTVEWKKENKGIDPNDLKIPRYHIKQGVSNPTLDIYQKDLFEYVAKLRRTKGRRWTDADYTFIKNFISLYNWTKQNHDVITRQKNQVIWRNLGVDLTKLPIIEGKKDHPYTSYLTEAQKKEMEEYKSRRTMEMSSGSRFDQTIKVHLLTFNDWMENLRTDDEFEIMKVPKRREVRAFSKGLPLFLYDLNTSLLYFNPRLGIKAPKGELVKTNETFKDGGEMNSEKEIQNNVESKLKELGFQWNPHSYRYGKQINENDYITGRYSVKNKEYIINGVHKFKTELGENSVGINHVFNNESDFFKKINEYLSKDKGIPNLSSMEFKHPTMPITYKIEPEGSKWILTESSPNWEEDNQMTFVSKTDALDHAKIMMGLKKEEDPEKYFLEQTELQKGITVEQEHRDTLEQIASGELSVDAEIDQTVKKDSIYAKNIAENLVFMGTDRDEWKAVPVIGETKTEVDGKTRKMPVFDFPKNYSKAPTMFKIEGQDLNCELCGKSGIKVLYYLQNDLKKWTLSVGSECVRNFEEGKSGQENLKLAKIEQAKKLDAAMIMLKKAVKDNFSKIVNIGYGRKEEQWKSLNVNDLPFDVSPLVFNKRYSIFVLMKDVYNNLPVFNYEYEIKNYQSNNSSKESVEKNLLSWFTRNEEKAQSQIKSLESVFNYLGIESPLKTQLQKGITVEQEHRDTLEQIASGELSVDEAIEQTAKDHIAEDPNYYDKLEEMEKDKSPNMEPTNYNELKAAIEFVLKSDHVDKVKNEKVERLLVDYMNEQVLETPSKLHDFLKVQKDLKLKNNQKVRFAWMIESTFGDKFNDAMEGKDLWSYIPDELKEAPSKKKIDFTPSPRSENLGKIIEPFTGTDDLRPVMMGVHFDKENKAIVATDAHKLLFIAEEPDVKETSTCIMGKNLERYKKNNPNNEPNHDGCFSVGKYKYPNYMAVIPKEYGYVFTITTKRLKEFASGAMAVSNEVTKQILFAVKPDDSQFVTKIGLNGAFLMDICNSMELLGHDEIDICLDIFLTKNRAIVFVPKGNSRKVSWNRIETDMALCMPVMVNEDHFTVYTPALNLATGEIKSFDRIRDDYRDNPDYDGTPVQTEVLTPEIETAEVVKEEPAPETSENVEELISGLDILLDTMEGSEREELQEVIDGLKLLKDTESFATGGTISSSNEKALPMIMLRDKTNDRLDEETFEQQFGKL